MGLLDEKKVISREKRASTITAYQGINKVLREDLRVTEIRQRIRTFSQGNQDEIIHALALLSHIKDTPVIIHGAIGCSAAELYLYKDNSNGTWYSTDLNERDTIMGGDDKLRTTIEQVYYKYRPEVIFVVATPVVAINNDDINSIILELEEEFDTKIISIYTDGFKTKAGINGTDIVLHSLARYIDEDSITEKTYERKNEGKNKGNEINSNNTDDFINLISITENEKSIKEITRLLEKLEVKYNLIPQFATIKDIKRTRLAKASIAIAEEEADVLLNGLNEKFQIPVIRSTVPIGLRGTGEWLLELGKVIGEQDKVNDLIMVEEERVKKYISKKPLARKKVFIDLELSVAAGLAEFVEELGGKVSGISVSHIDSLNKEWLKVLPEDVLIIAGDGQPFELANLLNKNKPDFYIGGTEQAGLAASLGIIPITVTNKILYGYEGAIQLIQAILKVEKRTGFVDYMALNSSIPYRESWLKKSANWYIKQEVK
ncbi:oxalate:formate antiporter [Anaerocolumna sedimenticola]|uniref:Oxalate:formate antiporter n=1 Tax=Anaerocolumna sedimenticola TaxID=2696063 RepID=A0A6P1TFM7_9FIRM|nr:nitrogenase component 1 [Anaerocolumna sedimenticola]QHQ59990.1 oxalate:formate antiporter [Anaerocolumna sedimenticola]